MAKPHPMQPLVMDGKVVRFKENKLVEFILANCKYDLNDLARIEQTTACTWSEDDYSQAMQLIGYSVGGYCELHRVSDEHKDAADEAAKRLLADQS